MGSDGVNLKTGHIVMERAAAYDQHYQTAGWKIEPWTIEKAEAFLFDAVVGEGENINGNEIQFALGLIGVPNIEGKLILDYCCGTGITAIYFAMVGAQVKAFDASSAAIDIARKNAELSGVADRVSFEVADARHLPYATDVFDAVFCQSALHIVVDYLECSRELVRVLKDGGKAVFCEEALDANVLLRPIRYLRRRNWNKCGGHPLKFMELESFGKPFSRTIIHPFNLLAQAKNLFSPQTFNRGGPWRSVKLLVRSLEKIDRLVLSVFPFMRRFCGKAVIEYVK